MASQPFPRPIPLVITLGLVLGGACHASSAQLIKEYPAVQQSAPPAAAPAPIAIATSPALYAQAIGDSQFVASHLELQADGYTVESGKLMGDRDKEEGALVMVRAEDGALTAIVLRDGKSGLLQVTAQGQQTFTLAPDYDWNTPDTVPGDENEQVQGPPPSAANPVYIDVLVGFTQTALAHTQLDPKAYALAQIEAVNLSLRNSKIENIGLRLAGIRIYDENIQVTTDGLARWQQLLAPLRTQYRSDINAGYSFRGGWAGWGYRPGSTSDNEITWTTVFLHEVAHNVGGTHCNEDDSNDYRFGYDAGNNIKTNLCGRTILYYSNPDVSIDGRPIGNVRTANMARLWREQAGRMAGYSPEYDGVRHTHVGAQSTLQITSASEPRQAFVTTSAAVGPTEPGPITGDYTRLSVPLRGPDDQVRTVILRGTCTVRGNQQHPMNTLAGCVYLDSANLHLQFERSDNRQLPAGWYNGPLELKLVAPGSEKKILVSVSVRS